eukprot:6572135-Ditylum_brightwellii.AAC.1
MKPTKGMVGWPLAAMWWLKEGCMAVALEAACNCARWLVGDGGTTACDVVGMLTWLIMDSMPLKNS